MITAASIIPILNTLSGEELAKVASYLDNRKLPAKPTTRKVILRPEHQVPCMETWLLEKHKTEIVYTRNRSCKSGN